MEKDTVKSSALKDTLQEMKDTLQEINKEDQVQTHLKELLKGKDTGYFIDLLSAELLKDFRSGYFVDENGNENWTRIERRPQLGQFASWRLANPVVNHFLGEIKQTLNGFKDEFLEHKTFKKVAKQIVECVCGPSQKQETAANVCGNNAKWAKAVVENSERYADKNAAVAYLRGKMKLEMEEKNVLPIVYLKLQAAKILMGIQATERAEALIKEVEEEVDWDFTERCLQSFKSTKELLKRNKEMVASCSESTTAADVDEVESPFLQAVRDIRRRNYKCEFKF